MIEVSVSKVKASFSEYLNRVAYGRERVVILSRGKPKAAIIGADDLRLIEELEEEREATMLAQAIESEPRFYSVAEPREIIFLVEPDPEGGYTARALGHSIFTQGDTLEGVRESIQDAVRCHFDDSQLPAILRLHIVQDEVVPV